MQTINQKNNFFLLGIGSFIGYMLTFACGPTKSNFLILLGFFFAAAYLAFFFKSDYKMRLMLGATSSIVTIIFLFGSLKWLYDSQKILFIIIFWFSFFVFIYSLFCLNKINDEIKYCLRREKEQSK